MKDQAAACRLAPMETEPTVKSRDVQKDVTDLVQSMGQTLNMAMLYGVAHKVTRSSLEISHAVISAFIELHGHIHFSIADGLLLINGESTADSPLAAGFTNRLTGLNLYSFTIGRGFSIEECVSLFSLFLTPPSKLAPGKSAAELMAGLGLNHIEAKSFSYRRVSQDEPEAGTPTSPSPKPSAAEPASAQPDLDNIMAFLKDDDLADSTRSTEDIRHLAADTEKLAELVLRAVEIRSSMANLAEGESLTDLIVGCIQKVVQPILTDPAAKTQKGRKHIKHSLLMLEKALLERLRGLAGDQATHATETMLDELVEDLDLDAIASKYMKSRRLAEKDSQKISRLLARAADDPAQLEELRDRLMDQGLTPAGWQELTVKLAAPPPGPGTGGTSDGEGVNEIKVLTLLLARIGETIRYPPATGTSPEVQTLITETSQHLATLADITGKKIETLQSLLTDETTHPDLSRKELLEILAEIAQEIMQPLTIITGTTAMIRSLRAGPLSNTQGELLSMIAESGERLIVLVTHLMHLAGMPEARLPDQDILSAAYQKPQPS